MLPDDILLEIFVSCRENPDFKFLWKWHLLVHVCRRWRQLIFESPHRLNLHIICTQKTPVRERLHIWPAFPIIIDYIEGIGPEGEDDVIAALGYPDRVSWLGLSVTCSELKKMLTVMQVPFPSLISLEIRLIDLAGGPADDDNVPVLTPGFLGGSAPRLERIQLLGVPFPTLPMFLLSTSNVDLLNLTIPPAGHISSEAMVLGLAALTRLKGLIITFHPDKFHPEQIHPHPVTRLILPALTKFLFQGDRAYLENLVARIDSPQLDRIYVTYLNQPFGVPVAQLPEFLDRSMGPKLNLLKHAGVIFSGNIVTFTMSFTEYGYGSSNFQILCEGMDPQVSNIARSFRQFSTTLSNIDHLQLEVQPVGSEATSTENVEWLHLLCQFSTLQSLYVSQDLAGQVALALQNIDGEVVAEVLPSLDCIYLEGQPASSVEKFVAARQFSGHPVTVVDTMTELRKRLKSSASR
jgi:hypothetical protein